MKRKSFSLLLLVLLSLSGFSQAKPYKVKAIKAFLFYNGENREDASVRGSLSENLIDNNDFALWNTIIGEGSAKAESNQTLVVVELTGNAKGLVSRKVVLTVTVNGKPIFRQAQNFEIYGQSKNYSAAFLLYNTGCDALKLKADVVSERQVNKKTVSTIESTLSKTIPFACGE